jgi:hypothetical protein
MAEESGRSNLVELVRGGDTAQATDALLHLTYNEPDRLWLQRFLLECLEPGVDRQIRALAVTCVGHVARLDHRVSSALVTRLNELRDDPVLGGIVEDALDDISSFTSGSSYRRGD